jgi:ribosomal protein S18 acetylase RimI-like enzyme
VSRTAEERADGHDERVQPDEPVQPADSVQPADPVLPTGSGSPTLAWPTRLDDELGTQVHTVVTDVVAAGGAVGWTTPPSRQETDDWLRTLLSDGSRVVVAVRDGRVVGIGTWSRLPAEVLAHNGEIRRVMVHRSARGLGLGRRITIALVASARELGIEQLLCDVRGNNHAAIALYLSLGFREYGRLPDFLAVGRHRFDRVRLYLPLQMAPDAVRHGSRPEGPGASVARADAPHAAGEARGSAAGGLDPGEPDTTIAS